jgi:hypothetical protein
MSSTNEGELVVDELDVVIVEDAETGEVVEIDVIEIIVDAEECRILAYEISMSDESGSPEENWLRAEQILREASDQPAETAEDGQ